MGKAGDVLKQVLGQYNLTQYRLAKILGVERTTVYRWIKGDRDPASDTVVEIVEALKTLNPEAAATFVQRYLGEIVDPPES
jgi:predicted transcriptional regulator